MQLVKQSNWLPWFTSLWAVMLPTQPAGYHSGALRLEEPTDAMADRLVQQAQAAGLDAESSGWSGTYSLTTNKPCIDREPGLFAHWAWISAF